MAHCKTLVCSGACKLLFAGEAGRRKLVRTRIQGRLLGIPRGRPAHSDGGRRGYLRNLPAAGIKRLVEARLQPARYTAHQRARKSSREPAKKQRTSQKEKAKET